ncbi:MAG: MarC family protein [Candidatus Thermoplasmatota archaeon]|jgi:multiple antibiotic resistance protein|nr:MarC family protein [Candidatus Thermoplasmatota archaeon]MCL5441277.1 MarC family protein [Candidatus Thermoplasmatota archaeon]
MSSSIIVEFLKIFMPLFVVIDPFGSLVLFMSMTSGITQQKRKLITKDAVIYGAIILLFFAIVGNEIIYFFGITIVALEFAGGLILLIMGVEMVREGDKPKSAGGNIEELDVGIVPFATPLLAGPGAISLVIILMKGSLLDDIFTVMSILILFAIVYLFFHYSEPILRVIGEKVMKAMTRIFGLIVAAFAVQYFLNAITLLGFLK